jgi:WD40 repeat protein
VALTPGGLHLLACSFDGSLRLWDLQAKDEGT